MSTYHFWQKWLFVCGIVMFVFGVLLALLYGTPVLDWLRIGINGAFWPGEAKMPPSVQPYQFWLIGLLGAAMAGWGTTISFIAFFPFQKKEKWAWFCLLSGVLAWFVIDESLSIYFHVFYNAIFNLGFLSMVLLPILFTAHELKIFDKISKKNQNV